MIDQAEKLRQRVKEQEEDTTSIRTAHVITVTSGKGGVGKTNVVVNLAVQLRKAGKRVVIIDADFGLANIEVMFGIVPKSTLSDVMNGKKTITEILTEGPLGVKFISGGSGVQDLIRLKDNQLSYFIKNLNLLDKITDFIIIDTGAGLTDAVLNFSKAADQILLVTTPEPTSITDAYALVKTLRSQHHSELPQIKLLVNRVENEAEGKEIYAKLRQVSRRFLDIEIDHLGSIPYDKDLVRSVKMQQPVSISFPKSDVSRSFETVIGKILNVPLEGQSSGIAAFVKKFMNIFAS